MGEVKWYAAGGDIVRTGPFASQVEACEAMRYAPDIAARTRLAHPENTRVWPERGPAAVAAGSWWRTGEPRSGRKRGAMSESKADELRRLAQAVVRLREEAALAPFHVAVDIDADEAATELGRALGFPRGCDAPEWVARAILAALEAERVVTLREASAVIWGESQRLCGTSAAPGDAVRKQGVEVGLRRAGNQLDFMAGDEHDPTCVFEPAKAENGKA